MCRFLITIYPFHEPTTLLQVKPSERWSVLDRCGWLPEGCTEAGWSQRAWEEESITAQSMKKILDPFNAQLRKVIVKTGLLDKLKQRAMSRAAQLVSGQPITHCGRPGEL
jgi:hypothetical protein